MGTGYWLRVMMMVAALVGVIWAMRHLNSGKVEVPTIDGPLSLCATRITWVEVDGLHLEEHKTHWMRTVNGGSMTELDGPETEKWFSRLCSAKIDLVQAEGEFHPAFRLGYVSGATAEVSRSISATSNGGGGEFKMNGQAFKSEGLEEALRTLPNIREATKPGQP